MKDDEMERARLAAKEIMAQSAYCLWPADAERNIAAGLLAFAQQPEGWVLVPREPTEAMIAGAVEELRLPWKLIDVLTRGWSAMLDVAPIPGEE